MLWGEERKCSATVVGMDLVLALSKVWLCSLNGLLNGSVHFADPQSMDYPKNTISNEYC